MDNRVLPIGSVIELEDNNKYIITGYNHLSKKGLAYTCAGYPTFYLIDMIPLKRLKEFKEKYGFYNTDNFVKNDMNYKVIFEGYKNEKYYELVRIMEEE